MKTLTRCPKCGAINNIAEEALGKAVACTSCRRIFVSGPLSDDERKQAAKESTKLIPFTEDAEHYRVRGIDLDLVRVPPGTFTMGNVMGSVNERPEHEVTITKPFYFATCPVSQYQYREIIEETPSYFQGDENPVETVSWSQALEFCHRLTELERVGGRIDGETYFRLPTESEWEYVGRLWEGNGSSGPHTSGETVLVEESTTIAELSKRAWFLDNSEGTSHPVARKSPNGLGVYDMQGNVAEWCMDWYGPYTGDAITDPMGPDSGQRKVRRGGGWSSVASRCRSTDRSGVQPDCRCALIGFRVVLVKGGSPPYDLDGYLVL